jgi:hypothetical protein
MKYDQFYSSKGITDFKVEKKNNKNQTNIRSVLYYMSKGKATSFLKIPM